MKSKPHSILALYSVLLLVVVGSSWPQSAGGEDSRLLQGIRAHNQAFGGDPNALSLALKLLGPEGWNRSPLALAYHGSALTLQAQSAKAAGKLMEALSLIDAGTKEMDEAVRVDSANLSIRVLRLENSLALIEGSPVDRSQQAKEDIEVLAARVLELSPEAGAIVDLDRGRLALSERRLEAALGLWRAAIRAAPDSEAAARARKLLARYGD